MDIKKQIFEGKMKITAWLIPILASFAEASCITIHLIAKYKIYIFNVLFNFGVRAGGSPLSAVQLASFFFFF
ncbi:MAG: hypothetical protein ACFFCS_14175 [Candidatus Hodarchaeota archaeon]